MDLPRLQGSGDGVERSEYDDFIIRLRLLECGRKGVLHIGENADRFGHAGALECSSQQLGICAARPAERRDEPCIDRVAHSIDDCSDIFVFEHRKYSDTAAAPLHAAQILREPVRCMWVVRNIQYDAGPPGQYLEARRQLDLHQAAADGAHLHGQSFAQSNECSECGRCIGELIRTAQRRRRQHRACAAPIPIFPPACPSAVPEVAIHQINLRVYGLCMLHYAARGLGLTYDGRHMCAQDAGLLAADLLARLAKITLMIEVHARDDCATRLESVDRIETSAQPYFQHRDIDLRLDEHQHRCERAELEVGERNIAARALYALKGSDQTAVLRFLAGDGYALVVAEQMRRRVETGAVARAAQTTFQYRA